MHTLQVFRELWYSFPMFKDIYAISYKMKRELYHRILAVVLAVIITVAMVALFTTFVLYPIRTVSVSMSPDVPAGSFELVTPLWRTPKRGDVMLVQAYSVEKKILPVRFANLLGRVLSAQQWQPFEEDAIGNVTTPFVRRVVGLPGDTIYLDKYLLYIKPKGQNHFLTEFELTQTKYNITVANPPLGWDMDLGAKGSVSEITLGDDEYFVLCDNRLESADSRVWGIVPQGAFRGKLLLVYFPFDKFRLF